MSPAKERGYAALLNLQAQPHCTVFLCDFALPVAELRRIRHQFQGIASRSLFIRVDRGIKHALQRLQAAGIDWRKDYLSLQGIVCRQKNLGLVYRLFEQFPRGDFARIDVPLVECGFRRSYASQSLRVIMQADYVEQRRISVRFRNMLAAASPYRVVIETSGAKLQIHDDAPWFELSGQLRDRWIRTLPDGEVAYSPGPLAPNVDGEFVVDGAVLPIAQGPQFGREARHLLALSREAARKPFRLHIRAGKVADVSGNRRASKLLTDHFEQNERYRNLNEVGISFNGAVRRFIHSWPAASNEVRPGVHLGIGGAANPEADDPQRSPMVHIDCIAANCRVSVNGRPFLRASS